MGASFWSHLIPYEANASNAFMRLQREVFEKRDYYSCDPARAFQSVEELREHEAENGTHSILDMERLADGPAPEKPDLEEAGRQLMAAIFGAPDPSLGTIYRLTEAEVKERFGVERLELAPDVTEFDWRRGTGRYAVIYEAEKPKWLWFGGLSGD